MFTDLLASGVPLLGILGVLALIDSLSYGTLAVPVWLLLTPGRIRPGRPIVYLLTIAVFYFAVGLLLLLGAVSIADAVAAALASDLGRLLVLAVGIGLVVWSFALDSPTAKARRARGGEGRIHRWRRIAMGDEGAQAAPAHPHPDAARSAGCLAVATRRPAGSYGALMGLALTAGLIEVASMLPYLAAIALITGSGMGTPASVATLAGYCALMIAPALVLLAARIIFGTRLEPQLRRLDAWLTKHANSALSWIVGIIGVVIVINTAPLVFGG